MINDIDCDTDINATSGFRYPLRHTLSMFFKGCEHTAVVCCLRLFGDLVRS